MSEPSTDAIDYVGEDDISLTFDYYSLFDRLFLQEQLFKSYNREMHALGALMAGSNYAIGNGSPESEYYTSAGDYWGQAIFSHQKLTDLSFKLMLYGSNKAGVFIGGGFSYSDIFSIMIGEGKTDMEQWFYPPPWLFEISIFNLFVRAEYFGPEVWYIDRVPKLEYEAGYRIDDQLFDSTILNKSILYVGFEQELDSYKLKGLFYEIYPVDFLRMNTFFRYSIYYEGQFDFTHGDAGLELDLILGNRIDFNFAIGAGAWFSNRMRGENIAGWMLHASFCTPFFGFNPEDEHIYYLALRLKLDFQVSYNYIETLNVLPMLDHFIYSFNVRWGI